MNYDPIEPDDKLNPPSGQDPTIGGEDSAEDNASIELDEEGAEDWDDDYDEPDPMDDYGSSGEKYGWYNGYSDDVIDDAFDGDPEATWNVD